jgi:hypothetical protein
LSSYFEKAEEDNLAHHKPDILLQGTSLDKLIHNDLSKDASINFSRKKHIHQINELNLSSLIKLNQQQ